MDTDIDSLSAQVNGKVCLLKCGTCLLFAPVWNRVANKQTRYSAPNIFTCFCSCSSLCRPTYFETGEPLMKLNEQRNTFHYFFFKLVYRPPVLQRQTGNNKRTTRNRFLRRSSLFRGLRSCDTPDTLCYHTAISHCSQYLAFHRGVNKQDVLREGERFDFRTYIRQQERTSSQEWCLRALFTIASPFIRDGNRLLLVMSWLRNKRVFTRLCVAHYVTQTL